MNIRNLFQDADLTKGFSAYNQALKETDKKVIAALIAEFSNSDGGNLFVGADDFGEATGLPVDEIIQAKSLIVSINQTLLFGKARLRYTVRNADLMSESCVLFVRILPSEERISLVLPKTSTESSYADQDFGDYVPFASAKSVNGTFDASSFSVYFSLCRQYRINHDMPDFSELLNAGLIDSSGYPSMEFLLWSDAPSSPCPKITAFLYRGSERSEFVLDSFESCSSLSSALASLISFAERNTRKGKAIDANGNKTDRKSYPGFSFVLALVAGLSHLDYSSSLGEIAISLFNNRIEVECSGLLLDSSCLNVPKNRLMHACLAVMGLTKSFDSCFQDIFKSYSDLPKSFEPKVLCGENSFTIILYDTLYEPTVFEERILNNELSPEQEKVLELLSSGPKTTLELMVKSPYRSRAAFGKFVINPLIGGGKIARIGKTNSPKAKLIRLG